MDLIYEWNAGALDELCDCNEKSSGSLGDNCLSTLISVLVCFIVGTCNM